MNTETQNELDEPVEVETPKLQLDMKVESTSACERHVTVTIPRDDIDRYFQKQFDELLPKAEVPGFRIGKAPRKLVENKFRNQVADQVKGSLLMDSLAQISDGDQFAAISEPDLDFETIELPNDGPLTYEFNIEVRPEFDLPDWNGLKLDKPEHEFSEDEINRTANSIFGRVLDLVPVEDEIQKDDYVVLNITAKHKGKVVAELEEESIQLRPKLIFSDATLDNFEKLMLGGKAGDEKSAKVTVSEFSEQEDLQGEAIELDFEILDVKRLDTSGDISEKVGMSSDELRKMVVESLERRLEYDQRQMIREQISQTLTESAKWELPPDLLKRQSRREMERAVIEMRSSGFSEDAIRAQENRLRQNILERTEKMLKEHFILERIAEEQNVEDSPADYELEIQRLAAQRNDSPRRVRARLERTGQMDTLRNMIIEQKVIELIKEQAKFKSVKYDSTETDDTVGVEFYVAGKPNTEIPEAKYETGESEALPVTKERD